MKTALFASRILLSGCLLTAVGAIAQGSQGAPPDDTRVNQRDRDRSQPTSDQQKINRLVERITNGPVVKNTTGTGTEIAWSTDAQGSSIVNYGTRPHVLNQIAEAPWGGTKESNGDFNHSVWITNLKPHTTYYFVVQTTQGAVTGSQAKSQVQEFHTK